jgi:MFS family permease
LLIFPRLSDIYGRKKVFYIGLGVYLFVVIFLLIFSNLYFYYVLIALMGVGLPARFLVGYIYLSEMIP